MFQSMLWPVLKRYMLNQQAAAARVEFYHHAPAATRRVEITQAHIQTNRQTQSIDGDDVVAVKEMKAHGFCVRNVKKKS